MDLNSYKKIAICISGSLRSLEFCINNFIENIIKPNEQTMHLVIFYFIPNDENATKINLVNLSNVVYSIKDDISLSNPRIIWNGRPNHAKTDSVSTGGLSGYLQQLYGIEQSYSMMKTYEKNNNTIFDYILRVRSDVIFKSPIIFQEFMLDSDDKIIVPNFHKWDGLNDRFAFGTRDKMDTYMNMYSNIFKISEEHIRSYNKLINISKAEYFTKINLEIHNISYLQKNTILFNRVRMSGAILKDSF